MINAISSVLVIFIIFSIGFFLTYRNIWPQNASMVLSVIVVKIAAPSVALISISDYFTPELLRQSFNSFLVAILFMVSLYLTGKVFSHLFKLPNGKKQVFELSFTFANALFIGLPVNELVFGQSAIPFLFTFYFISLALFWSIGAYVLSKASAKSGTGSFFKGIFNPAFVGVLAGYALVETQTSLPFVMDSAFRYLSVLCVPLALLVIGSNLVFFSKGIPKIHKHEWAMLAAKFIISPAYMLGLLSIFGIEGLAFKVFMLVSTMPCHMQTAILAEYYEVESAYASKLVSISTLASLIMIPVFVTLIG